MGFYTLYFRLKLHDNKNLKKGKKKTSVLFYSILFYFLFIYFFFTWEGSVPISRGLKLNKKFSVPKPQILQKFYFLKKITEFSKPLFFVPDRSLSSHLQPFGLPTYTKMKDEYPRDYSSQGLAKHLNPSCFCF